MALLQPRLVKMPVISRRKVTGCAAAASSILRVDLAWLPERTAVSVRLPSADGATRATETNFARAGLERRHSTSPVTSRSVPSAYFAMARNCWVARAPLSDAWAGAVRRDTILAAGQAAFVRS